VSHWYANQGWNRNLLLQLSGGPTRYQIDVYVVALFRFFYAEGAQNWTTAEARQWKRRFAALVYETWSEKWTLLSDISCRPVDVERLATPPPTARVRVHATDAESSPGFVPPRQRICAIKVFRRAPGESRSRQHADGLQPSGATFGELGSGSLSDTSRINTAELYEDSLELGQPSPVDGNRQITAMHEFGHLLGLMHPNDMEAGCSVDRSNDICYGQAYSPESGSIMGRGREVRREDYRVFAYIVSRHVNQIPSTGMSGALGLTHRLHWAVEGSPYDWCDGQPGQSASLDPGPRHSRAQPRAPRPVGLA
jgi:hypothetical protein